MGRLPDREGMGKARSIEDSVLELASCVVLFFSFFSSSSCYLCKQTGYWFRFSFCGLSFPLGPFLFLNTTGVFLFPPLAGKNSCTRLVCFSTDFILPYKKWLCHVTARTFFFFFLKSILAYGMCHGEPPGPPEGDLMPGSRRLLKEKEKTT